MHVFKNLLFIKSIHLQNNNNRLSIGYVGWFLTLPSPRLDFFTYICQQNSLLICILPPSKFQMSLIWNQFLIYISLIWSCKLQLIKISKAQNFEYQISDFCYFHRSILNQTKCISIKLCYHMKLPLKNFITVYLRAKTHVTIQEIRNFAF